MSEQPGNYVPTHPKAEPWQGTEIEQNPTKYEKGVVSGGEGQYKNDGGNE
jgi:hypothetical protein